MDLVSKAYSSIFEDRLCEMINETPEVVTDLCKSLNWEIQEGTYPRLIIPRRLAPARSSPESSEELLATLTEFVSFLEN